MSKFVCGDVVRYMDYTRLHTDYPQFFPKAGTIGFVVFDQDDGTCMVSWRPGSLLRNDDKRDWFCMENDLEKVEV